jgi:Holliday junction resolvase
MTQGTAGRRFEWKVRDALRADGYTVIRSAGSKGAVDLVAFKDGRRYRPDVVSIGQPGDVVYVEPGRHMLFVQAKRTNGTIPPAERAELIRYAHIARAIPVVAYQPKPRQPIAYRRLTGPGPKDWQPWTPDEVAP